MQPATVAQVTGGNEITVVQNSMGGWGNFLGDMQRFYGVNLECLNSEFRQEQQEYFMSTSAWADIHPSQLLGPPACFKHYDLLTVTLDEIAAPLQVCNPQESAACLGISCTFCATDRSLCALRRCCNCLLWF